MRQTFYAPGRLVEDRVRVLLLGAGGTGGEVLDALVRMHLALVQLGHAGGLHVTLMDGDVVSAANVGRQRFGVSDVGHPKALVLMHRYNLFFRLDWHAIPAYWTSEDRYAETALNRVDLLVSCVDRAAVRVALARQGARSNPNALWADFGNGATTGQFVLGHLAAELPDSLRLPNVVDLFSELESVDDAEEPSCSLAEALRQQDLFVNRLLADAGVAILWNLLRHGRIDTHGAFIDVRRPTVQPLAIDPEVWAFFGYRMRRETAVTGTAHRQPSHATA